MSLRRSALAAAGLFAVSTIAGLGLTSAGAAGNHGLPFITGGGHNENFNSDGDPSDGPFETTFGGGNAFATAPTPENDGETYLARGEIQGRSSDNATHKTTAKVHGDVVCMKNLGAPTAETGGKQDGGDVWEVRFRIERASQNGQPVMPGIYGSLMIQDNGPHGDYRDETFEAPADPRCGVSDNFQLEPHSGNFTVHNG